MSEITTISINDMFDVTKMVEGGIRNGYQVTVKPIYEAYYKARIDHYDLTFEKLVK